jgi:glycolate oxidase
MGIFPDVNSAMNSVFKSLANGANPVAMEFLDKLVIEALIAKLGVKLPQDAGGVLVGDVDGNVPEEVEFQIQTLRDSFLENGAVEFKVAQDEVEAQEIWFARKNASQSITIYGNKKLNEDISVPRSMLPEALDKIYAIGAKYGFKIPCFGHAGDGNIHVNVMIDISQIDEGHRCIEEIFKVVVEMGGTLSGEHGIGMSKAPFMDIAFSLEELQLFKDLKRAFDPNNILNPNKMGLEF